MFTPPDVLAARQRLAAHDPGLRLYIDRKREAEPWVVLRGAFPTGERVASGSSPEEAVNRTLASGAARW